MGKRVQMEESFAENQKHKRAAKPFFSVNRNTVKNASFTWCKVIASIKFLFHFLVPENLDSTLLKLYGCKHLKTLNSLKL